MLLNQYKLSFCCNWNMWVLFSSLFLMLLFPVGVYPKCLVELNGGVETIPFNSVTSFNRKLDVTPRVYPAQPQTFRFSKQASANASVYSNKVLQANTYRSVGGGQQVYPSVSYGASATYSQAASASVNLPIHLGAADKWTQPQSPLSSNVQSLAAVDMEGGMMHIPGTGAGGDADDKPSFGEDVPVGNAVPFVLVLLLVYALMFKRNKYEKV